jgi:hypothetical protein
MMMIEYDLLLFYIRPDVVEWVEMSSLFLLEFIFLKKSKMRDKENLS